MSSKTITLCDLCGKEMDISKNGRFVEAKSSDKTNIISICSVPDRHYPHGMPYDNTWRRADICPECHGNFKLFITVCRGE